MIAVWPYLNDGSMNAREDIAFLVGSTSRIEILEKLAERSFRPTVLAEQCSCARETAQRTLAGFVERGWVTKTDGRYELTPGGEQVFKQYSQLAGVVSGASRLREFLIEAGEEVTDLPVEMYSEVTVINATNCNPHAPIDRYLTVLGSESVGSFKGITPMVSRVFNEAAATAIGSKTQMELIIDESVLTVSETEYPDALQRAYDLDQFTLLLSPDTIEFGLTLVDGHVYIGAYDDHGNLVASVDGTSDVLYEWAENLYERYRRSAVHVEPELE